MWVDFTRPRTADDPPPKKGESPHRIRVHRSAGTSDLAEVRRKLAGETFTFHDSALFGGGGGLVLGNVGEGGSVKAASHHARTLAQAVERYLGKRALDVRQKMLTASSLEGVNADCERFLAHCRPGMLLTDVEAGAFDSYRAARLQAGISLSTLGKELKHLRTMWLFIEEECGGHKLPTRTFKPPVGWQPPQKAGFSDEQIDAILAGLDRIPLPSEQAEMRALILTFAHTGFAIADVAALKRSTITPAGEGCGRLQTERVKTGKDINLILPRELMEALAALPATGTDYYFWDERITMKTLKAKLSKRIVAFLESIGCPGTPHLFRHTRRRLLYKAGVSIEDMAAQLANTPAVIQQFYSGQIDEDRARLDAIPTRIKLGTPGKK